VCRHEGQTQGGADAGEPDARSEGDPAAGRSRSPSLGASGSLALASLAGFIESETSNQTSVIGRAKNAAQWQGPVMSQIACSDKPKSSGEPLPRKVDCHRAG